MRTNKIIRFANVCNVKTEQLWKPATGACIEEMLGEVTQTKAVCVVETNKVKVFYRDKNNNLISYSEDRFVADSEAGMLAYLNIVLSGLFKECSILEQSLAEA